MLALGFLIEYFIGMDYYYMIFAVGPVYGLVVGLAYIRSESLLILTHLILHFVLGYISLLFSTPLFLVSAHFCERHSLVRFLRYCPRDVAFTL